uniref:CUB domain-containing protein n=1 Tax=Caenorhabditis tropicalis TaxID=1561998 RepID=A0A1I7UME1_9PELO
MQALWPYNSNGNGNLPNYRHITWDKYYVNEHYDKHVNVSSGVAAGVTIGIFFIVFVLTFGCRIYSQYVDRGHGSSSTQNGETIMSESIASDMWICGRPSEPPPPYEIAIFMPTTSPCVVDV